MKKRAFLLLQTAGIFGLFLFLNTLAAAHDNVVVVPLGGAVGNATVADVVKGKTFSSKPAGKGITGTLELPPTMQTYTNSYNMTFNLIPAGTFIMGSPDDEPGGPYTAEQPKHQVTLTNSLYMQTTEVTEKQWQDVVHTSPSAGPKGGNYPVEDVTWFDAVYFANALSSLESPPLTQCYDLSACSGDLGSTYTCTSVGINADCTGYRLPTEAEWEYATRATTTTAWSYLIWYDNSADPGQTTGIVFNSNLEAMGWYNFNNTLSYSLGKKPTAKKQPNKWGLFDMHGNVWEWCQDWYDEDYYDDPLNGTDPQGPAASPVSRRVVRGGGWNSSADMSRSAHRNSYTQGFHSSLIGFRLVLSSDE